MDTPNSKTNVVKVRIEDLESKVRSKDDIDTVLRQCCKSFALTFRPILPARQVMNSHKILA